MVRAISSAERYGWILVISVLVVFTIPWFLWGNDQMVAGFPLWLWWHVGWMVVASLVFSLFARRAWGFGVVTPDETGHEGGDRA